MNVGVTATRSGLTKEQTDQARLLLTSFANGEGIEEFHHGDCVQGDEQLFDICRDVSPWTNTIAHPGTNDHGESPECAYTKSDVTLPAKKYLRRNVDIVKASDVMIACPGQAHEMKRGSGTWATIRECRNRGKKCIIIYPDGRTRAIQSRQNLEVSSY